MRTRNVYAKRVRETCTKLPYQRFCAPLIQLKICTKTAAPAPKGIGRIAVSRPYRTQPHDGYDHQNTYDIRKRALRI